MSIIKDKLYGKTKAILSKMLFQKTPDGWYQVTRPKKVFKLRYFGKCYMIEINKKEPNG
jgi:hypothetical protein